LATTRELLAAVEKDTGNALNPDQKSAIAHGDGPLLVLAGPGSGKTEVLVLRCLKLALVDRVEPRSIILATFTEKAARSMQERLLTRKAAIQERCDSVADVDMSEMRVGTLHSIASDIMHEFRYLPYQNVRLLDELEQLMFTHKRAAIAAAQSSQIKKPPPDDFWVTFAFLLDQHTGFYPGRWKRAKAGVDLFNRIVEDRVDATSMTTAPESQLRRAVELYGDYRHELESEKVVDFAHLQLHFLNFLESPQSRLFLRGDGTPARPGISHILVDEYQDTNPIQEMIYFRLASRSPHNISVVGDDEQALYRFRGADVRCILSFESAVAKLFGLKVKKVYLATNYRSLWPIVDFYNRLVVSSESTKLLRDLVGKPSIRAVRANDREHPVVAEILRTKTSETALDFARFVRGIKEAGTIADYSDCALLVRSTRERRPNGNLTEAGEFAKALRVAQIPVYNPRSRAVLEEPEVQVALGALLEGLDSTNRLGEQSCNQPLQNRVMEDWREAFRNVARDSPLGKYVVKVQDAIRKMPTSSLLDMELLEVFYAIISQKPLREAQDDPEQTLRLSLLSNVLEAYASVHGPDITIDNNCAGEVSLQWKLHFYYSFLDLLISEGLNDFEDEEESFPKGRFPIMTFHQAKGLEFPIVFVGSLDVDLEHLRWKSSSKEYVLEDLLKPYRGSLGSDRLPEFDALQRAEQDTIRLYYVAYSRAQDALILLMDKENKNERPLPIGPDMREILVRL